MNTQQGHLHTSKRHGLAESPQYIMTQRKGVGFATLSSLLPKSLSINDLARPGSRKSLSIRSLGDLVHFICFFICFSPKMALYCYYERSKR